MTKKRVKEITSGCGTLALLALIVVLIVGCLGYLGYLHDSQWDPTQDQLYGRWELVRYRRTSSDGRSYRWTVFYPSHESWVYGNFIQLNPDGTFSKQNFRMPETIITGKWTLNTPILYFTLDSIYEEDIPFTPRRGLRIHTDGDIPHVYDARPLNAHYGDTFLRMTYQRDGSSATYSEFFVRSDQ